MSIIVFPPRAFLVLMVRERLAVDSIHGPFQRGYRQRRPPSVEPYCRSFRNRTCMPSFGIVRTNYPSGVAGRRSNARYHIRTMCGGAGS